MNLAVEAADERSIEVLACGLPLQHGAQLAALWSALTSAGIGCPNAATTNGAVLHRARQDKEAKYWELLEGGCARAFASSLISSPADMWTDRHGRPDMADLFA